MTGKKRLTKKEIETGLATGQITYRDPKAKHRKGYEVRLVSHSNANTDTYPGLNDHPSREGTIEYTKHVDMSDLATVWIGIANEQYAQGGIPTWVRNALSDLDLLLYWQMAHYQMYWGRTAHMSLKTLSRNVGRRYRSVQIAIHRLLDIGAIELVQKHTGRSPAKYRVRQLSSLEKKPIIEANGEFLEANGETSSGEHTFVQKTKPLKGRVAHSPANAGRATPREKKPPRLLTIDEQRSLRAKNLARQEKASKPILVRPFFANEVGKETIKEALEIESLASKWKAVKETARNAGEVDLVNDCLIPALEADEDVLSGRVTGWLTSKPFNVTNLPKALDEVLNQLLAEMIHRRDNLQIQLRNVRDKRRREEQLRETQEREEKARLEKIALAQITRRETLVAEYAKTFQFLTTARELLEVVFPNFNTLLNNWGSGANLLSELQTSGKESRKIPDLPTRLKVEEVSSKIVENLDKLHNLRKEVLGEESNSSKDLLTKYWANSGEAWYLSFGSLEMTQGAGELSSFHFS